MYTVHDKRNEVSVSTGSVESCKQSFIVDEWIQMGRLDGWVDLHLKCKSDFLSD